MPSIVPGYEYDIFISYRQNDNRSGWVTEFVRALEDELAATLKDTVSIYFDSNPHDGLHETHDVDGSLKEKVKCLVFIPIISQTYCDPNAFAWKNELLPFLEFAKQDEIGLDVKVSGGNVAKRILPLRIHEIDGKDQKLFEDQIGGVMRPVDFIYRETGVNRPLKSTDDKNDNQYKTDYLNQVNKVANAVKEILESLSEPGDSNIENPISVGSSLEPKKAVTDKFKKRERQTRFPPDSSILKFALRIALPVILILLVGYSGYWFGSRLQINDTDLRPIQFDFEIKTMRGFGPGGTNDMAISPDGHLVCSAANDGGYLKSLGDRENITLLPGSDEVGFRNPFFSPDGKWIGAQNGISYTLVKYPVGGGTPRKICEIDGFINGASWHENTIYFGKDYSIFRVKSEGGVPELVYSAEDTLGVIIRNPQLLPDGNSILFTIYRGGDPEVVVLRQDNPGNLVKVMEHDDIQYLSTGEVIFRMEDQLYIQEFDYRTVKLKGNALLIDTPPILVRGVLPPVGQFAISDEALIYRTSDSEFEGGNRQLVWIDQKGTIEPITRPPYQFFYGPRISPDGTRVIVDMAHRGGFFQIAEVNLLTGILSLFTPGLYPIWHPDGQSIIYGQFLSGRTRVLQKPFNLGYEPRVLFESDKLIGPESISENGRFIIFEKKTSNVIEDSDIGYFDSRDSTIHMLDFINTAAREITPRLSPDGKWLAYSSDREGESQVYIVPFPGPGTSQRISVEKGYSPVWAPDMKFLYFVDGGREGSKLYRTRITIGTEILAEKPEALFSGQHVRRPSAGSQASGTEYGKFDIHPNGDKFLMLNYGDEIAPTVDFNVVVNWKQLK